MKANELPTNERLERSDWRSNLFAWYVNPIKNIFKKGFVGDVVVIRIFIRRNHTSFE